MILPQKHLLRLAVVLIFLILVSSTPSQAVKDGGSNFSDVDHALDRVYAIKVFNGYLSPLSRSVNVTGCDLLVGYRTGSVEIIYAGVCQLKSRARVMLCGDTGIGEFALTPWHGQRATPDTRIEVLKFTQANCPGG